jgi:hypothetical protein
MQLHTETHHFPIYWLENQTAWTQKINLNIFVLQSAIYEMRVVALRAGGVRYGARVCLQISGGGADSDLCDFGRST